MNIDEDNASLTEDYGNIRYQRGRTKVPRRLKGCAF